MNRKEVPMNSSGILKTARNGYIIVAVIFCALGIWLIADPVGSAERICILAGILFIADGIIKIIGYFSHDFYCLAFQFDLGSGILMIAVGSYPDPEKFHSQAAFCNLRIVDSGRCAA
ncbi:MAG: DUF308 domain-containing protein [Blautia sp.]